MKHIDTAGDMHVRTRPTQPIPSAPELAGGSPRKLPRHLQQGFPHSHGSPRAPTAGGAKGCFSADLLRKGWFWGAVGGAAAVVVIVVVLAVALTTRGMAGLRPAGDAVVLEYDMNNGGPRPPLKVQGAQLVRQADGKAIEIHGVNWFGFNNGKTMVDGLDAEPTPSWEGGDFATIVHTLKLLGFNAVRLPFQFADLFITKPQSFEKRCPGTMPSAASLAARAVAPNDSSAAASGRAAPPAPPLPPGSKPGVCNAYLPMTTTLDRYLWVVRYFVEQGFWVLIDYHTHLNEPALESPQALASNWLRLWRGLTALNSWEEELKGRVFLDVLNEPDEHRLGWDGPLPGSVHTASLADYYFAVMDAIHQESPGATLFFIQGGGQSALGTSWGDGFVTSSSLIQQRRMSDANAFFTALSTKPYRSQVVLAPHLYGASVTRSPDVGRVEWEKFETSWSYLMSPGYCLPEANSCQQYPVVAGEIGTSFKNALDLQYYNDMAAFFKRQPPTDGYKSAALNNWFWWAYNANSGDTGGLVADDWVTLNWEKLQWLQDTLGLQSWYML